MHDYNNFYNSNHIYLKICNYPAKYKESANAFQKEFQYMRNLQQLMKAENCGHIYSQLFPHYYQLEIKPDGKPVLSMEYFSGQSLENYLKHRQPHNSPYPLLTHKQILYIYAQLHNATVWLKRGNMIHLDLSPQNILLINNNFDIRLVDFTNCYYTNSSFLTTKQGYKKIDYRINSSLSPFKQLRNTYALLFTRLFFNGNEHYQTYFSCNLHTEKGEKNYEYFQKKYPCLLNCLFCPESAKNISWEDWYKRLIALLS